MKYLLRLLCCLGFALSGCTSPNAQLHKALRSDDPTAIATAAGRGADLNAALGSGLDGMLPEWTPLTFAAYSGRIESINALLKAGGDPNQCDGFGIAPLHYAASSQNLHIVSALLRGKADPNLLTIKGQSPEFAIAPPGFTALILATRANSLHTVALLLQSGAKPDLRDFAGCTAFWHAGGKVPPKRERQFDSQQREIRRLLLKSGADPDPRDNRKRTWLQAKQAAG